MTRHVSTENLARFRAGDLSTARSVRVAAHLRHCARCRETSEALAEVPALLASVPVPQMPAHLTARIETALAAESARRTAAETDRPAQHAGAHAGGSRRRPRRPLLGMPALRLAAAAGAAVVLVGGGVALLSQTGGGSSTAGGSAPASRPAMGTRHSAANTPEALPEAGTGAGASLPKLVHSGTDYQPGQLTRQVNRVLVTANSSLKYDTAGPDVTHFKSAHPSALSGCVSHVAAGRTVLLVDVAHFDHKPATIIVTARKGPVAAQVWVVGSGCSATTSDLLAHQVLPGH
jgi:hypothetical protein